MTVEELKQIQLYRQFITNKSDRFTVCRNLNGLQSQFLVNVYYGLKIRCNEEITPQNFGEGLVKNWTVRGTVHSFLKEDLPLFKYGKERHLNDNFKGYINRFTDAWMITPERQKYFSDFIVKKVSEGICNREELKLACAEYGMTPIESEAIFNQWGGGMRELCENGFLCYKVQEKKAFMTCPKFEPMEQDEAEVEMARRYFKNFAPATIKDTAYYFGWTQTLAKQIMSKLPLESIEINSKQYFYLDKLKNDYPDVPHCIMLSGFDQMMLGYQKQESIYLSQQNIHYIFNLAGIIMPPVLLDGNVVGRWRKKSSKMSFEMFDYIKCRDKKKIEDVMETLFNDIKKVEWNEL
jgi:hypothetical protein